MQVEEQTQVLRQLTSPMDRIGTNLDDVSPPQLPALQLPIQQNVVSVGPYRYNLSEDPLGLGAYGKVVRGWDSRAPERRCAIKIWRDQAVAETLQKEFRIISALSHPNIVKVYDYLKDEKGRPCLVMEYISGGELFNRIVARTRYTESNARDVIKALLEVIQTLHDGNVVHRDLKPENIILAGESDTEFKLIDFGISAEFGNSNGMFSMQGTHMYRAPEVILGHNGKENDMWAIGMITSVLLWGKYPFAPKLKYWEAGFTVSLPNNTVEVSSDARNFVTHLLDLNAATRMTVQVALQHPWITAASAVLEQNSLQEGLVELIRTQTQYNTLRRKLQNAFRVVRTAVRFRLARTPTLRVEENIHAAAVQTLTADSDEEEEAEPPSQRRRLQ